MVIALHQQRAQLLPAQIVQLVLPQALLVVFRVQLMGEAASSTVTKTTRCILQLFLSICSQAENFVFHFNLLHYTFQEQVKEQYCTVYF